MKDTVKTEIENLQEYLRTYGPRTIHSLLSALLIWLFGNLVFIPLAETLNWQTRTFCTLIFFLVFTFFVLRAIPGLKKLIDAFSVLPARKLALKKGISYDSSLILSQNGLQIIFAAVLYLLYFPFLAGFHPSINGIFLILVLLWIFVLSARILHVLLPKMLDWLVS